MRFGGPNKARKLEGRVEELERVVSSHDRVLEVLTEPEKPPKARGAAAKPPPRHKARKRAR